MRCFVALRPDDGARDRLDALARDWHRRFPAARRMRRANLHLTLAFIGELSGEAARRVAASMARQSWPADVWRVDRVGVFGNARVLWAGSEPDVRLAEIALRVRARLDDLQVRYDRKPFVPHVTLLRKLPSRSGLDAAPLVEPVIGWRTGPPVLLHSIHEAAGTRYVEPDPAAQ